MIRELAMPAVCDRSATLGTDRRAMKVLINIARPSLHFFCRGILPTGILWGFLPATKGNDQEVKRNESDEGMLN